MIASGACPELNADAFERTHMAFIPFAPILFYLAHFRLFGSSREKAEQTIWNRLRQLKALKTKRPRSRVPLRIGILGIHSFSDFSILRFGFLEFSYRAVVLKLPNVGTL